MPRSFASKSGNAEDLDETQPSQVIHFKNVPKFTSKHDLLKIISQFGPHEVLVILRPKEQALVEMKNIDDAIALYTHAKANPLIVHNCTLEVGYSIHQHLQSNPHDYTPSHIILITICGSAKAPLSLYEMAKMCNKIHDVVKILMFHHDAGPQALVQFRTSEEAKAVKESLEKEELLIDGNVITFEIQYSKFPDLRVSQNNKYTWDFTVCPLPTQDQNFSLPDSSSPSSEMDLKAKNSLSFHTSTRINNQYRKQQPNRSTIRLDYSLDSRPSSDSIHQLLNNTSLKSYRLQQQQQQQQQPQPQASQSPQSSQPISMEPAGPTNRWSSNSLQEYTNNNSMLPRPQYTTSLPESYDSINRCRAFSFNGRNSGSLPRLSSPDMRSMDVNRNSDPVSGVLPSLLSEYRPYRSMMSDYEIPMVPNGYHYSDSPRPNDILLDIHNCTVTFFTLHYTTKYESFINSLKDFCSIADYVVHRGSDSIIVAVAYFSHYGYKELSMLVSEKEGVMSSSIEVVNTVDYDSFYRIKDYIIPELLNLSVTPSLVNRLMEGQVKVFPVAICYSNFPSTFDWRDVYNFAKTYGTVEKISELDLSGKTSSLANQSEEIVEIGYRVQYSERYNILLILQNRSKLSLNGHLIKAEPLF